MKTILITASMFTAFSFMKQDKLTGRWESQPSAKGTVTGVVFREDQSFDGYLNKKPFVTGTYSLEDSIFTMTDNGCNGATGTYKIIFFSNDDSLRLQPINDPCTERMKGTSRLVLGRVKSIPMADPEPYDFLHHNQ